MALIRQLLPAFSANAALQAISVIFSLVIAVLLARYLGVQEYGRYSYALSWAGLLGLVALLGFNRLTVRTVPVYQLRQEYGLAKGFLKRSNQIVLCFSVCLSVLAGAFVHYAGDSFLEQGTRVVVVVAMVLLPITVMTQWRNGVLRSLKRVVIASLSDNLIQPALYVSALVIAWTLLDVDRSGISALSMNIGAAAVSLLFGVVILWRIMPVEIRNATEIFDTGNWMKSATGLFFVTGLFSINNQLDVFLIGSFGTPEQTGYYAIAWRAASVISLPMVALGATLLPHLAVMFADKDEETLQEAVSHFVLITAALASVLGITLVFAGHWLLPEIFGPKFAGSVPSLQILSIGQLAAVSMGPVSAILIMSNNEKYAAIGVFAGLAVKAPLMTALLLHFGIVGAAVGSVVGLLVWNTTMVYFAMTKTGVRTTILHALFVRRSE